MMDFVWKMNLKPILGIDQIVEGLECMFGMIKETGFRWLLQRWLSQ